MSGTVRIGMPPLFGTHFLPRVLARIAVAHPALRVEVVSTMRASDIVERRLDLAIVVGPLPDSSAVARPLGYGKFAVVAAPSYLARFGAPATPAQLERHACLTYAAPDGREAPFAFSSPPFQVAVSGPARSDDMHHLAAMAAAGLGLAQLPVFAVADAIAAGSLVVVLDGHEPEPKLASLVFPGGRELPRRVRVLVEALTSAEAEMPGATAKKPHPRRATD